jgi:hypothetical protein
MMDDLIVKNEEEKKFLPNKVALHHFKAKVRQTIPVMIAGL